MALPSEAVSSQGAAPQSPLLSPQPGTDNEACQAPPDTLYKAKVRWSWHSFEGSFGVRLFSWEGNDTSRVKGDDGEEPAETDLQRIARVDAQSHLTGLQHDLVQSDNDVVREQVAAASDLFMEESLKLVEEDQQELMEAVLGKKTTFGASSCEWADGGVAAAVADIEAGSAGDGRGSAAEQNRGPAMADGPQLSDDDDFVNAPPGASRGGAATDAKASSSRADNAKEPIGADGLASLSHIEQSDAAEDAEDMLTAAAAVRGLASKLSFGTVFDSKESGDLLVRTMHAPLRKVTTVKVSDS